MNTRRVVRRNPFREGAACPALASPVSQTAVCETDNPIALDVATRRGRKPKSHGDRDHRLGADSVLSWHGPSAVPRQAHVGRLSDSSVGEHAMADDAATVEQLK